MRYMLQQYSRKEMTISIAIISALFFAVILFTPFSRSLALSIFGYSYNADGTLKEAGSVSDSSSPYWWLNSGAYLRISNGVGMTNQGKLSSTDPWRVLYNSASPTDTGNGYYPQNLFRLITKSTWNNVRVESMFKIKNDNFLSSPNRNGSNGLLLMSRYQANGDTVYYAGIRVDGDAVIKKKKNGAYTTLAQKEIFAGSYSVASNVNLLPHNSWVTLRSETVTNSDGSVSIRLYMKKAGEASFTKILEAKDTSNPISSSGVAGIRTDFMDVEFDNFRAEVI